MVIVKLMGGLGNQMFQYALGRTLSLARGTELKLDISHYSRYPLHRYALGHLNVQETFASPRETYRAKAFGWWNDTLKRYAAQKARPDAWAWVRELEYRFDKQVLDARINCYLDGYWQSEKYFKHQEKLIRGDFTLKSTLDARSEKLAAEIRGCNSVSVHVRRGDYVSNSKALEVHGACPAEYYREAASMIRARVSDLHFFVFSDDPEWTRNNVRVGGSATYVTHNSAERNYADLHLMSLCQHHIIANSSFSWWGAWLAVNPSKIVIAPKQWFQKAPHDTSDLIPDGWIRM